MDTPTVAEEPRLPWEDADINLAEGPAAAFDTRDAEPVPCLSTRTSPSGHEPQRSG